MTTPETREICKYFAKDIDERIQVKFDRLQKLLGDVKSQLIEIDTRLRKIQSKR